MPEAGLFLVLIVTVSLAFDFINGFHDTANAIATVVSTRVLTPRAAIVMAAGLNFVGALLSTKVASTISGGLVLASAATQSVILAALIGAIAWNLITWRLGIPSSSSHALIGGLCGAALSHGGGRVIIWKGLLGKVIIPLFASPIAGFVIGFIVMTSIYLIFARIRHRRVNYVFRHLQIWSAALMALNHGLNDAQKTMGIITLALVGLRILHTNAVPTWVKLACAVAMALGTSAGGWRIIKTMGHRIIRLEPVHGFAAETTASIVILVASRFGMPVSTTHVISGSIFGVGASRRLSAVRWGVAVDMLTAWILTLPMAAAIAAVSYFIITALGFR
jgi:PiT family inorganic phosphate transporter